MDEFNESTTVEVTEEVTPAENLGYTAPRDTKREALIFTGGVVTGAAAGVGGYHLFKAIKARRAAKKAAKAAKEATEAAD